MVKSILLLAMCLVGCSPTEYPPIQIAPETLCSGTLVQMDGQRLIMRCSNGEEIKISSYKYNFTVIKYKPE